MPSISRPRHQTEFWQAVLIGGAYVLAVQLAFLVMPFTTETLWIGVLGLWEAINYGHLLGFLMSGETWLAFAFPLCLFTLGGLAAYAYLAYQNPVPAVIAGVFLTLLYTTEVVYAGRFEYAILYVAVTPVITLFAIGSHLLAPQRRHRAIT